MVGDDVRVAHRCRGSRALFPPSLVAHVENEDKEREEEGVADADGCIDRMRCSGVFAVIQLKIKGGVA